MKITSGLVILLLVLLATSARAMDIKGVEIGATWNAQAIQKLLREGSKPSDPQRVTCDRKLCYGYVSLGENFYVPIDVTMRSGKVDEIRLHFIQGLAPRARKALEAKFGPAPRVYDLQKRTDLGIPVEAFVPVWEKDNQILTLDPYYTTEECEIDLRQIHPESEAPKTNL